MADALKEARAASGTDEPSILLVDDHLPNLVALEAVLGPLGCRLIKALSGQEALRRALHDEFVLIVMDVQMPGLDGYQTVEMFRQRDRLRDVPVVFLTAVNGLQEHVHRGYALGAADYVTKPFDPVALRGKVAALVSLYLKGRREERARRQQVELIKDLFLGAIGHDLRDPLQSILVGTRLLLADCAAPTDCRQRRHAERIAISAARMQGIVEDVLDLTRGKFSGGIALSIEDVDLTRICRSVIAEIQGCHPERRIELQVAGDTCGEWDRDRLARVLSSLVGNAIQHTAEGPVRMQLSGDVTHVRVRVHCHGSPVESAMLREILERFRRGETTAEGLGLGLYIVREIIQAHGGSIEVDSSEAEGTLFAIVLPRKAARRAGPHAALEPMVSPPMP